MTPRQPILGLLVVALLAGCSAPTAPPVATPANEPACINPDVSGACVPVHAELNLPSQASVFRTIDVQWSLINGSYGSIADPAHSTLSQVRIANAPVPDNQLAGPETFGDAVPDMERTHQNLPANFQGTLRFETPGTYYVRVYMHARSTGFQGGNESDLWSPEIQLEVLPVTPTGVTHVIAHAAGGPLGTLSPASASAQLGDSVQFDNQDLIEHEFVFTEAPAGFTATSVVVAAQSTSEAFMLAFPGAYRIRVDDVVKAQGADISVKV